MIDIINGEVILDATSTARPFWCSWHSGVLGSLSSHLLYRELFSSWGILRAFLCSLDCTSAFVSSGILLSSPLCFKATMLFAELTYTLATEEAERIGVDHVARMTATGSGENSTGEG